MQVQALILSLLFLLLGAQDDEVHGLVRGGEAAAGREGGGGTGLAQAVYVFGDLYVDTGNHDPDSPNADIAKPWKPPYGSTWPGQPSGRYSDGRIFTDFYVSKIHGNEPIPFKAINMSAGQWLGINNSGINFAFGGSGVFSTSNPLVLNVSMQIQQLRTTIDLGIVSVHDLSQSQVLFVLSGNDYFSYAQKYPDFTFCKEMMYKHVVPYGQPSLYVLFVDDYEAMRLQPLVRIVRLCESEH